MEVRIQIITLTFVFVTVPYCLGSDFHQIIAQDLLLTNKSAHYSAYVGCPFPVVLMWLYEIKRDKENGGKSYEAIMCQAQLIVDGMLYNSPESSKIGLHLLKQFGVPWPLLILNLRFITTRVCG